ncbi:LysE family translocator [Thalassotalea fusca]
MDLMHGLILISSIHLLAAASPGPDFVLVSQQSLHHSRAAGLWCSLGITLGLSIHLLYSMFGLATIIANSSTALWAIKILGGGYLLYLGYQGLTAKANHAPAQGNPQAKQATTPLKSISLGFVCNALNPKAPIYFVSLFTIILSPDMPLHHLAIYGAWIMCIQFAWFSFVSIMLSQPKVSEQFHRMGHWLDRVMGGAMALLGLKVLFTKVN